MYFFHPAFIKTLPMCFRSCDYSSGPLIKSGNMQVALIWMPELFFYLKYAGFFKDFKKWLNLIPCAVTERRRRQQTSINLDLFEANVTKS